jgi:S-formylglutathione hydrolase FrmB
MMLAMGSIAGNDAGASSADFKATLAVVKPPSGSAKEVAGGAGRSSSSAICASPRCVAESIAFDGRDIEFNVLLPPGYDDRHNNRRYPVLYLLHGGLSADCAEGGCQDEWLDPRFLDTVAFTEGLPAAQHAIVVTPTTGAIGFYVDWPDGSRRWETFHVSVLVPHVDARYRTIPDRAHRAVAGLSMGGYGAAHYAARHPDVFSVAGAFSGVVDVAHPAWVGVETSIGFSMLATCVATSEQDPLGVCDGSPTDPRRPIGPFGDAVRDELHRRNHNPTDLTPNLARVFVYAAWGNGVPRSGQTPGLDNGIGPDPTELLEPIIAEQNRSFDAALQQAGVSHVSDFYGAGTHTYRYWQRDLHVFWPLMIEAFGSPSPSSFDYRSADAQFSVWGWTFATDPDRAPEFLDIADASASAVTLTGSGVASVTTAALFAPRATVTLSNAVESAVIADDAGRITFHVDLGAVHLHQQYTVAQRLAEAQAPDSYWTTRTVTFRLRGCGPMRRCLRWSALERWS